MIVKNEVNQNLLFENYPDIVNIRQMRTMLGIGKNLAYELLHSNTIKSLRIGREYKIPKIYIIQYVLEQ